VLDVAAAQLSMEKQIENPQSILVRQAFEVGGKLFHGFFEI
jgi:hypothetical protein